MDIARRRDWISCSPMLVSWLREFEPRACCPQSSSTPPSPSPSPLTSHLSSLISYPAPTPHPPPPPHPSASRTSSYRLSAPPRMLGESTPDLGSQEGLYTKQGYTIQFGTNVLGHHRLITRLLPVLRGTSSAHPEDPARVITLSSAGHSAAPSGGVDYRSVVRESGVVLDSGNRPRRGKVSEGTKPHHTAKHVANHLTNHVASHVSSHIATALLRASRGSWSSLTHRPSTNG
jgi:hypothetical protein